MTKTYVHAKLGIHLLLNTLQIYLALYLFVHLPYIQACVLTFLSFYSYLELTYTVTCALTSTFKIIQESKILDN